MIVVGSIVRFEDSRLIGEDGNDVPLGATLNFLRGFMIRQTIDGGASGYGFPPENFWMTKVAEQNGQVGLLLPEGDEDWKTHVQKGDEIVEETAKIHHGPVFVPLATIRYSSVAEVVALP